MLELIPIVAKEGISVTLLFGMALWIFKDLKERKENCSKELQLAREALQVANNQISNLQHRILHLETQLNTLKSNLLQ